MTDWACRACGARTGDLVLDLGLQPACDYFPRAGDTGPDPEYPLQMWLCGSCGLAQMMEDTPAPEKRGAAEPEALVRQAAAAVAGVAAAGLLPAGGRAGEFGSPHGGSWLGLLADRGLKLAADDEPADVLVDCCGMMHDADQAAAMARRAARTAPGGVLLLQYHSLAAIVAHGQWNELRHGHFAYYSTPALTGMLAGVGFTAVTAWSFDLYGGTVLVAARRDSDGAGEPDAAVAELLAAEDKAGVTDPAALMALQHDSQARAAGLRDWLTEQRQAGRRVLGYGAASRAIALLRRAGIDRDLLPAVADASPAKQGLRMPGTDIPVVSPAELVARRPDAVVLFLADLRAEVSAAYPEVEEGGGQWIDADSLGS